MDPGAKAVEVWRFGDHEGETRHQRFADRLPVRAGGETVGEVNLEEIFARG